MGFVCLIVVVLVILFVFFVFCRQQLRCVVRQLLFSRRSSTSSNFVTLYLLNEEMASVEIGRCSDVVVFFLSSIIILIVSQRLV